MQLYNIKDHTEQVSFEQAIKQGLGRNQGLFFPSELPRWDYDQIDELLALDFVTRSAKILHAVIGSEISEQKMQELVANAFEFPAPIKAVTDNIYALELFHGPTLAFKDFGGRFMAQCLSHFSENDEKITILTATSGDTGAAVAHAFHNLENIDVVVLYPNGKISPLQEALFCTLGDNIHTMAIEGTFDDCQTMVKQAFDDEGLRKAVGLNSANSINISRLLAQTCYYFEAVAQLEREDRMDLVFSVPSGNFGNLTAGLIAKAMGLPIKRFIAATNVNDTVPRYLETGKWEPKPTIPTLANAMDVSAPNNWPRIEELFKTRAWPMSALLYGAIDDAATVETLKAMYEQDYLCEPHGAIAFNQLQAQMTEGEQGIFLCTAHPAKFKESVDDALGLDLPLPQALADAAEKSLLSEYIENDFELVKAKLLSL